MQIKTNNVPRPLLSWSDLTKREKLLTEQGDDNLECDEWTGFRFKGNVYNLDDFPVLSESSEAKKLGWDAAMATSAFHGILIKLGKDDLNSVVVGQHFA